MGLTNFDELNTLSTTETTKDDRHKATRKKIPIHDYFENMQISEEEKEKRVRLANLLLADVLFLFALSKRNQDKQYLSEAFQKRYLSSVQKVAEPDQKMQRYIRKVCDSIVDTTLKGGSLTTSKANKPQDPYVVSVDRATNVAENEANAILNGDEYITAVKNGCTKKRWKSYRDERVRADHADVDGQVVDISRPFRVGKYMMMYPKDDSLGAGLEEIVNCRCSVEYIKNHSLQTELEDDIITDKCIIQRNKIVMYLLKPGAKHYDEFVSVGYSSQNPRKLAEDIIAAFDVDNVEGKRNTQHGTSFNVHMLLGVNVKKRFNTAWQIDNNSDKKIPRLISAYREDA
jgi:phage protein F-like protein